MIPIGFILGSGLYCITCVRDRELGLRYLLNFAGMNPAAYYIGLICAEMVIFFIPCLLLIMFSFLTNLEQFTNHAGVILTTLLIFGVPFIALNQLISFLFDKTETAFKYQALLVILSYAAPAFAAPYIGRVADPKMALYLSPVILLNEAINNILLGEVQKDITTTVFERLWK